MLGGHVQWMGSTGTAFADASVSWFPALAWPMLAEACCGLALAACVGLLLGSLRERWLAAGRDPGALVPARAAYS